MSEVSPSDLSNLQKVLRFPDSDRNSKCFTPFVVFMAYLMSCNPQKVWVEEQVIVICRALGIATTLCTDGATSHIRATYGGIEGYRPDFDRGERFKSVDPNDPDSYPVVARHTTKLQLCRAS